MCACHPETIGQIASGVFLCVDSVVSLPFMAESVAWQVCNTLKEIGSSDSVKVGWILCWFCMQLDQRRAIEPLFGKVFFCIAKHWICLNSKIFLVSDYFADE